MAPPWPWPSSTSAVGEDTSNQLRGPRWQALGFATCCWSDRNVVNRCHTSPRKREMEARQPKEGYATPVNDISDHHLQPERGNESRARYAESRENRRAICNDPAMVNACDRWRNGALEAIHCQSRRSAINIIVMFVTNVAVAAVVVVNVCEIFMHNHSFFSFCSNFSGGER